MIYYEPTFITTFKKRHRLWDLYLNHYTDTFFVVEHGEPGTKRPVLELDCNIFAFEFKPGKLCLVPDSAIKKGGSI